MKNLFLNGKFSISGFLLIIVIFFQIALSLSLSAQNQNSSTLSLVTWVNLEGSMTDEQESGTFTLPMRSTMNSSNMLPGQCFADDRGIHYFPAGQPYNKAPWNYYGTEGAIYDSHGDPVAGSAGYAETCIDWILVSLRSAPDGENLCRKAALLHSDGLVEFDSPFSSASLEDFSAFYIVIEHRNHLVIMSDTLVKVVNGSITYDFRNHQSYIDDPFNFGAVGQKELPGLPGVFAMYSGNSDQVKAGSELPGDRTQINNNDRSLWDFHNGMVPGYCCSDFNLNCDCNYNDRTTMEFNNSLFSSVPVE